MKLTRLLNFTFPYIDDVLSLNNSRIGNYVDHIYPIELEIKPQIQIGLLHTFTYIHLKIDGEGQLITKLVHKRDDLNFHILNFICSNIPAATAYRISLSLYYIPELLVPIMISLIEGCC